MTPQSDTKKKASVYVRLSKEDQDDDNLRVESQVKLCEKYAADNGFEVVQTYVDDGLSGALEDRPAIQQAITDAHAGDYQALITRSHRRFARDIPVANQLRDSFQRAGIELHYVLSGGYTDPDTEAGIVQDAIGDLIAHLERMRITRRTSEGRRTMAKAGRLQISRRPFGYELSYADAHSPQQIEPHPEEAAIVQEIFEWAAEGESGAEIARRLNDQAIYKPSGLEWISRDVLRLLRRELYKGTWLFQQTMVVDTKGNPNLGKREGKKTPMSRDAMIEVTATGIVNEELWKQVNDKLMARTRTHMPHVRNVHEYILRQRIFCRECGNKYWTDTQLPEHVGAGPIANYYYRHATWKNTCEFRHAFERDELEGRVKRWIIEWVDNPEVDWDLLLGRADPDNALLTKELKQVDRQLGELSRERPRVIRMTTKGLIDEAEAERELTRIQNDQEDLENHRNEIETEMASEIYFEATNEPPEGWDTITTEEYAKLGPEPEYTFEEWQALVVKHSIEIEVDAEGNVFGTFEASPEVYIIPPTDDRSQTWEVSNTPGPVA